MESLTTKALGDACRVFLSVAYPGGASAIPASKLAYYDIPPKAPLEDFLTPSGCAPGICQELSKRAGGLVGYEFRLGSAQYPHLKLRVQQIELHDQYVWVFSVDTHDGFHRATQFLNGEEADAWRVLVENNRALKHQIEEALGQEGFLTPVRLLRIDLTAQTSS